MKPSLEARTPERAIAPHEVAKVEGPKRERTPPAKRASFAAPATPDVVRFDPAKRVSPSPLPALEWGQVPGAAAAPASPRKSASRDPSQNSNRSSAKGKGKGKKGQKKNGKGKDRAKGQKGKGRGKKGEAKKVRFVSMGARKDKGQAKGAS